MSWFKRNKGLLRVVCVYAIVSFLSSAIFPANMQAGEITLPAPNQFVQLSGTYSFPTLKGLKFNPAAPFEMKFIIDTGDVKTISKEDAAQLIRYFLAGLTIPEKDIWVNMSPYEQDKMITPNLAATDLGKDLLSQDYILKQISSSLTYPEGDIGKDFWARTYDEVLKVAKTTNLPINTYNKIWIVPDKAVVYENAEIALITEATLRTMLEEDYLALKSNVGDIQKQKKNLQEGLIEQINKVSSNVVRQVILPKINQDVNSGKNFAALRQIHHSLILAAWFKEKFKDSIYKYYIDKGKVKGIDLADKGAKEKIYNLYVEAFKKGIYNYIKTDTEPQTKRKIKRQYFSGGFDFKSPDGNIIDSRIALTDDNEPKVISSALGVNYQEDMVVAVRQSPIIPTAAAQLKSTTAASALNARAQEKEIKDSLFPLIREGRGNDEKVYGQLELLRKKFGIEPLEKFGEKLHADAKALGRGTLRIPKDKVDDETNYLAAISYLYEKVGVFVDEKKVVTPEALDTALADIGIKVKNIKLVPLQGKPLQSLTAEEIKDLRTALGIAISQALGTAYTVGIQKTKDKKLADNTSLSLGISALLMLSLENPNTAYVSWGSEGKRDTAWDWAVGTIAYRGEIFHSTKKVGDKYRFDKETYDTTVNKLKAQNPLLELKYKWLDALEGTNASVAEQRIGEDPNSWAVAAISKNAELPEHDADWRIAGVSYNAPKPLEGIITPFPDPQEFYDEFAKAYGVDPNDSGRMSEFMSKQTMEVLWQSSWDKEARKNHELIYKKGKKLAEKYPGFIVLGPGDGDLIHRLFSILGIPLNGHNVTVFGRSGSIEGAIAFLTTAFARNGYFVNTRVSPTATAKELNSDTAHQFTPAELESGQELGYIDEQKLKEVRTRMPFGSNTGAVVLVSVNDPLPGQFGKEDVERYKGVEIMQGETSTSFVLRALAATPKGPILAMVDLEAPPVKKLGENISAVFAEIAKHVVASSGIAADKTPQEIRALRTILMKKALFMGNWKERKVKLQSGELVEFTEEGMRQKLRKHKQKFLGSEEKFKDAEIGLLIEDKWVELAVKELEGTNTSVGVQSLFFGDPKNPDNFTQKSLQAKIDKAVAMGAVYANVGHSMHRRGGKGLTNAQANKILQAILADGRLIPWYTIEVTTPDEETTRKEIEAGINEGLAGISEEQALSFPITPEPSFKISTAAGVGVVDTSIVVSAEDTASARLTLEALEKKYGHPVDVNTGYGASVKPENAKSIFSDKSIKNALIGGASLEADDFYATVENGMAGKASVVSSALTNTPGGIDLGGINVKAAAGSSPVSLKNLPAIDLLNVEGFTFEIMGIQPFTTPNLNAFFGIVSKENKQANENEKLALKR